MQSTQQKAVRLITLLVFIAAAWIYVQRTIAVPLTFYETAADERTAPTVPLSARALTALATKYPKEGYFAAFAAHPDGHFGWVSGRHSMDDARREALERCNRGRSGCVIQSMIFPKKYNADFVGNTVAQRAVAKNIARYLPVEGSLWYALSPDGAWAVQSGKDGGVIAAWRVWRRCQAYLQDSKRPVYYSQNGCRLFYGPAYSVKK